MSAWSSIFFVLALLLFGTHRLPAPIQEVPESPTPTPEQSAKPKPKRTVKPKASEDPEGSPRRKAPAESAKLTATSEPNQHKLNPYAGAWRGVINCSVCGDLEHLIVIDDAQKTMTVSKTSSGAGGANGSAPTFVGPDGLTATLPGLNGTWALKPNTDGKTVRVRLTGFMLNSSAIFYRQ